MKIYSSNCRKARLADVRITITRDSRASAPWSAMDMVFNPRADDVEDKPRYNPGRQTIATRMAVDEDGDCYFFYATEGRVIELCGDDAEFLSEDGLEKIWQQEKRTILNWLHGRLYEAELERWNPDERRFDYENGMRHLYGPEDVDDAVAELSEGETDVVVCADQYECPELELERD